MIIAAVFNWLSGLDAWVKVLMSLGGSTIAVAAFSKRARKLMVRLILSRRERARQQAALFSEVRGLSGKLDSLLEKSAATDARMEVIEKEHKVNGGRSTKDYIVRLESYRKYQFWTQARPAFECDSHGHNTLVSEAYCMLVGVANETELMRLDWRQFMFIEDEPSYFASFKIAAGSGSAFRGRARFTDKHGESRGVWEVRAVPLGPRDRGEIAYVGHLSPADELAKQIADENRWTC